MLNEFKEIVDKYNKDLVEAFVNIINNAVVLAKENKLDDIQTFIYINEEIENGFKRLSKVLGRTYIEESYQIPISYNVYREIIYHTDFYLDNAINKFNELNEEIINAKSDEEFSTKKRKLIEIISNPIIRKYKDLFEENVSKKTK